MKALIDNALQFHQTALNLQAHRQQMIASNIANADTPNYKARDVDFRGALQGALNQRFAPLALATSSAAHLTSANSLPFETYTGYRVPMQASADGNTVNMDVERAAFTENSLHYEASVTFISSLLSGMRTAISGQ
jgi:flagellar basal-body rod protein FlgB